MQEGDKKWHILTAKTDTGAEWSRIGARKAAQLRFAQFPDVVRIKTSRSRGVNDAVPAASTSIHSEVLTGRLHQRCSCACPSTVLEIVKLPNGDTWAIVPRFLSKPFQMRYMADCTLWTARPARRPNSPIFHGAGARYGLLQKERRGLPGIRHAPEKERADLRARPSELQVAPRES